MPKTKADPGRDTRKAILDASLRLFSERGYFGTSMREIARAVGIRESAIYHHFLNKEALLEQLALDAGDEKHQRMEEIIAAHGAGPVEALLQAIARSMVERWRDPRDQQLWRMMATEGFRLAEEGKLPVDMNMRKARARLEQLFRELAAAGKIRPVNPGLAGLEFVAALQLLRTVVASPKASPLPEGVTIEDIAASHVRFFCDAVVLPSPMRSPG